MKLYFLRHAQADPPDWRGADDDRPLDGQGQRDARRVGKFLRRSGAAPSAILASPLARAFQTARIVAKRLGQEPSEEPLLAPGFDAAKLAAIIARHPESDLMLVGHEPDFSETLLTLTGGSIKMAKGAVARIATDGADLHGELLWLVTPKLLERRGR